MGVFEEQVIWFSTVFNTHWWLHKDWLYLCVWCGSIALCILFLVKTPCDVIIRVSEEEHHRSHYQTLSLSPTPHWIVSFQCHVLGIRMNSDELGQPPQRAGSRTLSQNMYCVLTSQVRRYTLKTPHSTWRWKWARPPAWRAPSAAALLWPPAGSETKSRCCALYILSLPL